MTTTETPYQTTQQWRADELGDAHARAQNWRYAFTCTLGLLAVAVLLLGYVGTLPHLKPYYVEIDTCTGQARVVGPAPERVTIRGESLKDQARTFVQQLRRVSSDKVLMGTDWSETGLYAHVTARGRQLLNQQVLEHNPLAAKDLTMVEVLPMLAASERTLDVRWIETRYSLKGERLESHPYRGIFTWTQQEPKTKEEIDHNPLRIFWDQWSFSQEN